MRKLVLILLLLPLSSFAKSSDFLEYYDLVGGTDQLQRAKIFVIGEKHNVFSDIVMREKLIVEYAPSHQTGTTYMLVEGAVLGNKSIHIPSDRYEVPGAESIQAEADAKLIAMGWDHPEAFGRVVNGYKQMHSNSKLREDENLPLIANIFSLFDGLGWLLEKNYANAIRDKNMTEQIKNINLNDDGSKIFVGCGQNHITNNHLLIPALESMGFEYAGLVPKENHPDRTEFIDAEDYLKTLME